MVSEKRPFCHPKRFAGKGFDDYSLVMDPVTHLTAGALSGRAAADHLAPWKMMVFCLVAAGLPDMDSFFGGGPEKYLVYHRSFTHSVLGVIVLAFFISGVFKLFWREASFRFLLFIGLAVIALQVYLDLATTFGTQIFWPFTRHRYAFPGVFIIDPFFTLALLTILILSFVRKNQRRSMGLLGVFFAVGYPLFNWGVGTALEEPLAKRLASRGMEVEKIHVTTDLFTPVYWKVVAEDKDQYGVGASNLTLSMVDPPLMMFPKPDPVLVGRLSQESSFFRTWFWFARYPVVSSVTENEKGREIIFLDLRFFSRSPVGRKLFPDFEPPFTLTAQLDKGGVLVAYAYHRHGKTLFTKVPD
jgi:inner membrane protein